MRLLSITIICAGVLVSSSPALALHCYALALKDDKGALVPANPPPIGLMIGGNPVIEGAYPPHAVREPIAPAECPASLVEGIRAAFNASCIGDATRKKAAAENKVSVEQINKGCSEMNDALQNKDVEFYRERDKKLFPAKPGLFPKKPGEK